MLNAKNKGRLKTKEAAYLFALRSARYVLPATYFYLVRCASASKRKNFIRP